MYLNYKWSGILENNIVRNMEVVLIPYNYLGNYCGRGDRICDEKMATNLQQQRGEDL